MIRVVRLEGRKAEQCWVTCSAVEFEPKPLGPAIPAKYLSVAFIGLPALESCKDKIAFEGGTGNHLAIYIYTYYIY